MNVSKDTLRSVANWQFVFALNIWCKIVTEVEGMEDLHLPLVQIVFGVFDLISGSPRLVPLTFHMIRCALMLCGPDQKYVPLWAPILELIKFLPTGKKAPRIEVLMESDVNKSSALPDFQMALKISGAQIKNKRHGITTCTFMLQKNNVLHLASWLEHPISNESLFKHQTVFNLLKLIYNAFIIF